MASFMDVHKLMMEQMFEGIGTGLERVKEGHANDWLKTDRKDPNDYDVHVIFKEDYTISQQDVNDGSEGKTTQQKIIQGKLAHSRWWRHDGKATSSISTLHDLHDATNEQRHDEKFVLAAVTEDGRCLRYASEGIPPLGQPFKDHAFQNNRKIVLAALEQNGRALEFCHEDMRDDEAIVLAAVKNNGFALQYASVFLKDSEKVGLAACTQNPWSIQHCSDTLLDSKDFVLKVLETGGYVYECISEHMQKNEEVKQAAIRGGRLDMATEDQCKDSDIVFSAVSIQGRNLRLASNELKQDKNIVMAAVKNCGLSLKYASEKLQCDREIVKAAVTQNSQSLEFASYALQHDKEFQNSGGGINSSTEGKSKSKSSVLREVHQMLDTLIKEQNRF